MEVVHMEPHILNDGECDCTCMECVVEEHDNGYDCICKDCVCRTRGFPWDGVGH